MSDLTLAEFLAARLDEDEAAAMAATGTAWAWEATGDKDNSWAIGYVEDEDGHPLSGEIEHGQGIVIDGVCESISGHLPDAVHIARHDPARVLREVGAGRKILHEHRAQRHEDCGTLRILAAVYCDHPDYDEAWRP